MFRKKGALARSYSPIAVSADFVYCHRAGLLEVAALRGPVTLESRPARCLIHAENHRAPVALALSVSGHSHPAAAQAKAVPAAVEADQQWVAEDKVDKAVPEVEEEVAEVEAGVAAEDNRLQFHSTGTHSSNSR